MDEYVASQVLYLKLTRNRLHFYQNPSTWIAVGAFFILIAWGQRAFNWAPILLTLIGGHWIYAGLVNLFPTRYFRGQYAKSESWGKRFRAEVNEDGFEVVGEQCAWRIRWQGVKVRGENDVVFMFYSANTVFIFGKRYLNEEQREELRRLSGVGPLTTSS
ncbi:MAG TPA: YcxB family protein [Terriglobales bacterium]|nr:YcxB family protein [Terriglobales bacterium]